MFFQKAKLLLSAYISIPMVLRIIPSAIKLEALILKARAMATLGCAEGARTEKWLAKIWKEM